MALLMILDLSSPGGAGAVRYWGTWTLTLIVLALVGIAVGDELDHRALRRRDQRHDPRTRPGPSRLTS
jgi:hypothetical protein